MQTGKSQSNRAADIIAQRLFEAGCRYAFGIPGGEVLTLVDALRKAGISFVLAKHENSAGFMAEGAMHVTGAPAVLVATVGPGAVNGVNVVANAHQDRVPMIVLTGRIDAVDTLSYTHQVLDHQAVFRPITKETFCLTAEGADLTIDKALAIATTARAGPVHIDVPISVADQPCVPARSRNQENTGAVAPVEDDQLLQARSWLANSKRPIMIAGLDAVAENASEDIRWFCERFNVPVITTYKGKGLVSEHHPLSLGGAGLSPLADRTLVPLVQRSDLIICAGYDPIEMRTGWRDIWDPAETNVIDISAEPNRHYMYHSTVSFVAATAAALRALGRDVTPSTSWPDGEIAKAQKELEAAFSDGGRWGPAMVVSECQAVMPDNTLVTADSGAHRILLSQIWKCREPKTLLQSSGLCTMGCSVPLAIGSKLASPQRPVLSFSGDAGMLMVAGELSTARELQQNTIFIVFVDASLALIEMKQRKRGLENCGVDFSFHDFADIGRAFGGNGFTVRSPEELREALSIAMADEKFSVIAALFDRQAYDGKI